jgi:hypothetical protein
MSTPCCFSQTLPIVSHILSFLQAYEWILHCARVSKWMRRSIQTPALWKDVLLSISTDYFCCKFERDNERKNQQILHMHPKHAAVRWSSHGAQFWSGFIRNISWNLTQNAYKKRSVTPYFSEEDIFQLQTQLQENALLIHSFYLVVSAKRILIRNDAVKTIYIETCTPSMMQFKNLKHLFLQFESLPVLLPEKLLRQLQLPSALSTLSMHYLKFLQQPGFNQFCVANSAVLGNLRCLELFNCMSSMCLSKNISWNNLEQLTICKSSVDTEKSSAIEIPASVQRLTLHKFRFQRVLFHRPQTIQSLHILRCDIRNSEIPVLQSLECLKEMHFLGNVGANDVLIRSLFDCWIERKQCVSFLCDKHEINDIKLYDNWFHFHGLQDNQSCCELRMHNDNHLYPFLSRGLEIHISCLRKFIRKQYLQSDNATVDSIPITAFRVLVQ